MVYQLAGDMAFLIQFFLLGVMMILQVKVSKIYEITDISNMCMPQIHAIGH